MDLTGQTDVCVLCCAGRRRRTGECDAEYIDVCSLNKVESVLSRRVAKAVAPFAEPCLYLDATCG